MTKNWYAELSRSKNSGATLVERLLFRVAKKWVSGNSYKEALSSAKNSNNKGISAILNFLGEDTTDHMIIEQTVKEYCMLLDLISSNTINGCISVKPTQVGLRISYDMCLCNFKLTAEKAKSLGRFMWIDVESFNFVENTIAISLELLKDHKQVGVAIQSYLKRSSSDLLHLLEQGANVRLVKGAYKENENNAFQSMNKVNLNFSKLMKILFENSENSDIFAIATHDPRLIKEAISLSKKYGTDKKKFEFQLLMGINDEIKEILIEKGYRVSEYIPYGNQWLAYSLRRIRERKRNVFLLARSLIRS